MTTATIKDLPLSRALDYKAMSSITGAGGAPWVFGAFIPESDRILPIVNFYQTNNVFVADQLNVQFQTIAVDNSGSNSAINISAGQNGVNFKIGG
jgi:hypothetical protein